MSLLIGTFAVGTSPSVSLAVLSETRAKGRLSDLVLGAAVFKDLIVVVLLAVDVAVVSALLSGGATDGATVTRQIAVELGYTTLVGVALGILLILYVRFVHAEMLLLVAAMILVIAELSKVLHLELLLVFIVAGFVVRNFSRFERELHDPLQLVSLPVFVVFFTIAGASVDLRVLLALLPLALALSLLRAFGFWIASRAGGALGGESEAIKSSAWLGYLPLAGVTLGLIGLASARIPALSKEILGLGMAFVSVNLLVGPITLRYALGRVGEIPDAKRPARDERRGATSVAAEPALVDLEAELEQQRERLRHPALAEALERMERELGDAVGGFWGQTLEPWSAALGRSARSAVPEAESKLDEVRRFVDEASVDDSATRAERAEALFEELESRLRDMPLVIDVPLDREDRRVRRGDSFVTRWRRRRLTLGHVASFGRAKPRREVPVRMLARTSLEPCLAALANRVLGSWARAQAGVTEALRSRVAGETDADQTRAAIELVLDGFRQSFERDARRMLVSGLARFAELAARAGGPSLPAREIRYSNVEPEVRAIVDALPSSAEAWGIAVRAAQHTLLLWVELHGIDRAIDGALRDDVLRPLAEACEASIPKVELVHERIAELVGKVSPDAAPRPDEIEALLHACRSAFPAVAQAELRQTRARFARTATGRDLALALRALVNGLPSKLTVLRPTMSVHTAEDPRAIGVRTVNPKLIADQKLVGELLPIVDNVIAEVSTRIAVASAQIREAVDVAVHALEPGPSGSESLDPELVRRGIVHAAERLEQIRQGLAEAATRTREELVGRVETTRTELHTLMLGQPSGDQALARAETPGGRLLRALGDRVRPFWRQVKATYAEVLADFQRLYGSELSRDIQIRYARTAMDAGAIRAYLAEWSSVRELPPSYARLFGLEPLRDRRFFVANRSE
jgi:Kef-type K+ transport system membrane component KefB